MNKKKQKIYQCTHCDFLSNRRCRFESHMKVHLNVRDHICKECGKGFINSTNLKNHIRWKHMEKAFKCEFCTYKTSTLAHLREHIRTQHTHRDHKPYKCAYCDYRCAISGNCRKHVMNRHKGMEVKWVRVEEKYPKNKPAVHLAGSSVMREVRDMATQKMRSLRELLPENEEVTSMVNQLGKTMNQSEVAQVVHDMNERQNNMATSGVNQQHVQHHVRNSAAAVAEHGLPFDTNNAVATDKSHEQQSLMQQHPGSSSTQMIPPLLAVPIPPMSTLCLQQQQAELSNQGVRQLQHVQNTPQGVTWHWSY